MSFLFPASHLTAKSQIAIDEPASFKLLQPKSLDEAARMLRDHGPEAVALAGGCDILEKIKTQWIRPRYVVDLKPALGKQIEPEVIGAGASLSHIARNDRLPAALRQAALAVATPQIRNVGTIGGNVLQDSRCPYYRGPWHCYRAGGITCDAVRGYTHEHALWGGERCYTVSPSDTAVALVAIGAEFEVWREHGVDRQPIETIFSLPSHNITSMHRLEPGELLQSIRLPKRDAARKSVFRKAAMRTSWDFALASVAVDCQMDGETCQDVRIVLGAVAPTPWRAVAAENVLKNAPVKDRIEAAVRASVNGAQPLAHNEYKIGLVKSLVRECLEEIAR